MTVYITGTIVTAILGYGYSQYRRNYVSTLYLGAKRFSFDPIQYIPMIPLAVIAGIRYDVGQDYMYTYVRIFNNIVSGHTDSAWGDLGFTYLNILVAKFTDDYAGIFIITSCVFIFFVFRGIYKQSRNIVFSMILLITTGYYFCFMNGVRQMLASSILLFSIQYINSRNLSKFALCMIVASLFHFSAIAFIPFYIIYNYKWSNKTIIIAVVCTFALSEILTKFLTSGISLTKYSWYLDSNYQAQREGIIMILINILVLIFAMLLNKEYKNEIYVKAQMAAVMSTAFIGNIPVAHRVLWIFGLPSIILIPNTIACHPDKRTRVFLTVIITAMYAAYFIYTVGVKNSNSVLPYQTIFTR